MQHKKFVPKSQDERGYAEGSILLKLCQSGTVSSEHWIGGYIIIKDGMLKIYNENKTETIMEFALDSKRRPSSWKRKDYSPTDGKTVNLYTFYILKDNSFLSSFMYKRKVKIGCTDLDLAEKLVRCIEFNTENKATETLKN